MSNNLGSELKRAEPSSEPSSSPVLRSNVVGHEERTGEREAPPVLPCLSSNNCTNEEKDERKKHNVLLGGHKRTAFLLSHEIQELAREFGVEKLGFLTLTFRDHVTDIKEAQKRFHSLRTHVIQKRYRKAIGVWERTKAGRIHFHLLVVVGEDIRTGLNFDEIKNENYRSANAKIKSEWAFWRKTAPLYGFGRTELLPIKSNAEGIARYVGKYVSKHIEQRFEADKGARIVRFIGYKRGERKGSRKFTWNTTCAWLWAMKVKSLCEEIGARDTFDLARLFGPRWAYRLQQVILNQPLGKVVFPSLRVANLYLNESLGFAVAREKVRMAQPLRKEFELSSARKKYFPMWYLQPFREIKLKHRAIRKSDFDEVLEDWELNQEGC